MCSVTMKLHPLCGRPTVRKQLQEQWLKQLLPLGERSSQLLRSMTAPLFASFCKATGTCINVSTCKLKDFRAFKLSSFNCNIGTCGWIFSSYMSRAHCLLIFADYSVISFFLLFLETSNPIACKHKFQMARWERDVL